VASSTETHRQRAPWPLTAGALASAALFSAPLVYLVARNLPGDASLNWAAARIVTPLGNSLMLATAVAGAATLLGTLAAWLVARTDLPAASLWRVLLPLPLVIPSFIGAFVLLAAFAPGGLLESLLRPLGLSGLGQTRGFAGSFIVLTLFTYPYVYLPAQARFRQLPPSLEESARLLGRRPIATFFTVVLPQARSAILAGALLVFLYAVGDFGVVQLLRYNTLTRAIYTTRLFDRPVSLALSLLLAVVALAVVAAERALAGRRTFEMQRGVRPLRNHLGRWRAGATAFLTLLVGLSLAVPVGVLVWWSARGIVRGSTGGTDLLSALSSVAGPALNTSLASIAAAVGAIVLVAPIAYLTARYRSRAGDAANAVVVGGFALPGLALALALAVVTLGAPSPIGRLYQTLPLLVFAYVVHFGAHALRTSQVAVAGVPRAVEDAARVLGAAGIARFVRVELPLMAPGLFAGVGLVLLSSMKELPASLLLAPAGFQTLAMKIWGATESAMFADAGLASLVLILVSGVLTWALVIRRGEAFV